MVGSGSGAFKVSDVKELVPFIERHGAALAEAIAPGEAAEDLSLAILRQSDRALTLRAEALGRVRLVKCFNDKIRLPDLVILRNGTHYVRSLFRD